MDRIKRKTLSELSVPPLTKIPGSAHAFTSGEFRLLLNLKTATRPKAMCIFAVENAILAIRNPQRVETMRGSRNFCRGWGGWVQARLPENSSDNVSFKSSFILVLNLFYSFTVVYQIKWFI